MAAIFDDRNRYATWRALWIALARAESAVGIPIPEQAFTEMEAHRYSIDFERVREIERETRHDVMAHLHHFGEQCPSAKPFLHLGATSCFITDNTDLILVKQALQLISARLARLILLMRDFCAAYRALPVLGYTHFQPAQPTTLGKRASLWLQDYLNDFQSIRDFTEKIPLRGTKGTTGTQASFLELMNGDPVRVEEMESHFLSGLGFRKAFPVTGQTYPRKFDWSISTLLEGIAISSGKMSRDLRLIQHMKELSEPRGDKQVGSSAMPYKRNPMRSERLTSLSRYLLNLTRNAVDTAVDQWLERTLDDSAGRRLYLPQAFLTTDAILILGQDIFSGLTVHNEIIDARLRAELPFLLVETILMEGVKRGGDRQTLHERLREHAMAASDEQRRGLSNSFFQRVANDPDIPFSEKELENVSDPARLVGLAPRQVDTFLAEHADTFEEATRVASPITKVEV